MDDKRFILALPGIAIALLLSAAVDAGVSESVIKLRQASPVYTTADASGERQLYIVQFADPPALAMHGRASRSQGTASVVNRFDPDDTPVRAYMDEPRGKQKKLLRAFNLEQQQVYSFLW